MSRTLRGVLRRLGLERRRPALPLRGWEPSGVESPLLDALSDAELEELNALLAWNCFTVDGAGRRFGAAARAGKRDTPQPIPDPRIEALHRRVDLSSKSVLEIGCFEGVHTSGLCRVARDVTAVDGRMENVVKTIVRTALYGFHPRVFVCNVEDPAHALRLPAADVVHHVGVLYHLVDPASHLAAVARLTRGTLMLDTHYAPAEEASQSYEWEGRTLRFKSYREFGHADPFSGMYADSKWLRLEDLLTILEEAGLPAIEVVERRIERNGTRVLLYASRAPTP